MKAKTILFSSCLKPKIVTAMVQAFDAAWADVGRHFSGPEIDEAQLVLVKSLLANDFDSPEPQELSLRSMNGLMRRYPWLAHPAVRPRRAILDSVDRAQTCG